MFVSSLIYNFADVVSYHDLILFFIIIPKSRKGAMKMKTYSIDYTKISEAANRLNDAGKMLVDDREDAAAVSIAEAHSQLLDYLNGDNLVEDNDIADGLVKQLEIFDNDQIDLIRFVFIHILLYVRSEKMRREERKILLNIINICQKQLGNNEYESIRQFYNIKSFKFS